MSVLTGFPLPVKGSIQAGLPGRRNLITLWTTSATSEPLCGVPKKKIAFVESRIDWKRSLVSFALTKAWKQMLTDNVNIDFRQTTHLLAY